MSEHEKYTPRERKIGVSETPSRLRKLGRNLLDRLNVKAEFAHVPPELETVSGKRPKLESAHIGTYNEPLKYSWGLDHSEGDIKAAKDYVNHIFPKVDAQLLSLDGSSAYVFEDTEKKYVFKVSRHYGNEHSYVEREAALLSKLSEHNLAPRLELLVDPKPELQYGGRDFATSGDVKIPRINEGGDLAIIVMEKINFTSIDRMPDEKLVSEFDRALEVSRKLDISFQDTEFEYDTDNNRLIAIDVGAVCAEPVESWVRDDFPEWEDEKFVEVRQIADLLDHTARSRGVTDFGIKEIEATLRTGGMSAIHELLLKPRPEIPIQAS